VAVYPPTSRSGISVKSIPRVVWLAFAIVLVIATDRAAAFTTEGSRKRRRNIKRLQPPRKALSLSSVVHRVADPATLRESVLPMLAHLSVLSAMGEGCCRSKLAHCYCAYNDYYKNSQGRAQGKLPMKSRSRAIAPTTVKRTVPPGRLPNAEYRTREYLTEREVERLRKAAGNNRHGHRDATMILMAFRHGLRASELCSLRWEQVDLVHGRLHVHRVKNGMPSVHPLTGIELRALRRLQREQKPGRYENRADRERSSVGAHGRAH
jgi:integrase